MSTGFETPRGSGVRAQRIAWCSSGPVAARCCTVAGGAGWAVAPLSLANCGGASDPLRSKIDGGASDPPRSRICGGASDPPSSLICGVLAIPKQIFWRGLLWFPAFRCWEMPALASRLNWAEPTMPRTYLLYRSYVTSLQRVQSLPRTKGTKIVSARIPHASSFRLTSRDHLPTCPAVLAARPIPTCNKSHRNYFWRGSPPPLHFDLLLETPHLLAQRSLQRVQSLPATKATETVFGGNPPRFFISTCF